ncbi:MAG: divalent-cation tolerance protein CutA [Terriglobales bacterium]|jgi:periplasmic divalent cation tolerance protein
MAKTIVLTTAGTRDEARRIAHALVERRLAACANIVGPIESVYRWNNTVNVSEEWLLLIKTTASAFPAVNQAISELHSYELPECIQLPIEGGSSKYLQWIAESVK